MRGLAKKGVVEGCSVYLSVYVPDSSLEDAGVCITRDTQGRKLYPEDVLALFYLPSRELDEAWLAQFWASYQADARYRQYIARFFRLGSFAEGPAFAEAIGIAIEQQNDVSIAIARPIEALQDIGVTIQAVSAGSTRHRPSLLCQSRIPDALHQLARAAGFESDGKRITSPVSGARPYFMLAASAAFCLLLAHWHNQSVVQPARFYRDLWQPSVWGSALPVLPDDPESLKRQRHTSWLIGRSTALSAWRKAEPRDYYRVKSGRDEFSRMKLTELLTYLNKSEVPTPLDSWGEAGQKRVLRWMARGAPLFFALKKVEGELAFERRARQESEKV